MPTGYAPYEEAAARGQARMSVLQRLGQIFAGAGQGIAASRYAGSPLESAFLGFSGGYRGSRAAQMAAEQYAMKQIAAERANEERQARLGLIEAQTERAKRPAPPPKESKPAKDTEAERILGRPLTEDEKKKLAGVYIAPKAPGKGTKTVAPKPLKPLHIPRRIPPGLTEQSIIDSINQQTDPSVLMPYYTGRGGADSEAIRRAAQLRANELQGQRH